MTLTPADVNVTSAPGAIIPMPTKTPISALQVRGTFFVCLIFLDSGYIGIRKLVRLFSFAGLVFRFLDHL